MFFYNGNTHKTCTFSTADKICEAALTLFSQQGFFNTSVHHIQQEAQVSIGSIYHHFGSKEAIANKLYAKILDQMNDAFVDIISQHESFQDKYFHITKLLFEMTETESRTMKFIFHTKYSEYCDLNKSIYQSKPFQTIYKEVTISCDSEVMKEQLETIDLIMASLFSLPIQLIQLHLDGVIKTPITERTAITNKLVWDGLCDHKTIK